MAKSPRLDPGNGASGDRLWLHLGNRLKFRREQLGVGSPRAAAHLGVTLQTYEEYETGDCLIPARQLAELSDLFAVPVFYFFEDLRISDEKPDVEQPKQDAAYTIATQVDRIAALIDDFQKLNFEKQQHLLFIARALATDTTTSRASA